MHQMLPTLADDRTCAPEPTEPPLVDPRKYLVYSRPEIAACLRLMCGSGDMVAAHFAGGDDFFLSTLLAVWPEPGEFLVEAPAGAKLRERALREGSLAFVATHQRIRLQFSAGPVRLHRDAGREVLALPLPGELLRLQRRDDFRVPLPLTRPLLCSIAAQPPLLERATTVNVTDISCGGVAVVNWGEQLRLEVGNRFRDCLLELPGMGQVRVELQVRSSSEALTLNGKKRRRAGCEFVAISGRDRAILQRFVDRLDHDYRGRLTHP
jgi:c-di-GMP-binding flagellar brake protein YcgR